MNGHHRHRAPVALTLVALITACATRQPQPAPTPEVATAPETAPETMPETMPAEETAGIRLEEGLAVAERPELGTYLTDASGRAVYLLEADPTGESTCYDACAQTWPPVLSTDPTATDPAVQAALMGTIERRDGTMQVTYGGHPLYYYAEDAGPGTITGQHVHDRWGEWYLVEPSGQALEAQGS